MSDDFFNTTNTTKPGEKKVDNFFFTEHAPKPDANKKKANLFSVSDSDSSSEDEQFTTRKINIQKTNTHKVNDAPTKKVTEAPQLEDYERDDYKEAMEKIKKDVAERRRIEEEEKQEKIKRDEEKKRRVELARKKQLEEEERIEKEQQEATQRALELQARSKIVQEPVEVKKKNLFDSKSIFKQDDEDLNDILQGVSEIKVVEKKKPPTLPPRGNANKPQLPERSTQSKPKVDTNSDGFDFDKYITSSSGSTQKKKGLFD